MMFLFAPLTHKILSQTFHHTVALMDPNNGAADSTRSPKTWQFPFMAFRGQFLERGRVCVAKGMHAC